MNAGISLADITIRNNLQPGDLGFVAYMHAMLYAKEMGYGINFEGYVLNGLGEFAHQYDPTKDKVWICEHEGKIIGSLVGFHRNSDIQFRYFIFLPEYRGIGLGKHLMAEFMNYARASGCKNIYLWTTTEQATAISLYTRFGFKQTGEKFSTAFDKPLTELRFDMTL
ncbi:GNAT family N-acetyltransferase [[Flexibacter] sp. ATCC 35208]|uniref:GNAT family N-acetyltransferase n=1 Tax=[Flexibacter] sp. ATCC 35208 TaxID=1936242 RepID=UPI0009CA7226|nr:GNAT family N-acetyltransferase [[Flexibacter] sp. ATCC 35208]OMP78884.1 GNAT family N-acetyltransferase [[Flexibacter] sp. ATCC 35208]